MKMSIRFLILFLAIWTLNSVKVLAQQNEWNCDTLDNGQLTVKYRINHYTDISGNDSLIIEDETTFTGKISFSKCVELMADASMHKEFSGDKESIKIKDISSSVSIVYYFTKNPWPIKNSDCVARMTSSIDYDKHVAVFTFSAAPNEYKMNDVSRMTQYDIVYTYRQLPDGNVVLTVTGRTSPPVKVPLKLIKSAFPGVPAKAVRKIVDLTKV